MKAQDCTMIVSNSPSWIKTRALSTQSRASFTSAAYTGGEGRRGRGLYGRGGEVAGRQGGLGELSPGG